MDIAYVRSIESKRRKIKKGYLFPDMELYFDELIYSLENSPSEESRGIINKK